MVDLTLGVISLAGVTQSALFGFEDALAFLGDAVLIGDEGPNRLEGGDENDHLEGRGGDDRLLGGAVITFSTAAMGSMPASMAGRS